MIREDGTAGGRKSCLLTKRFFLWEVASIFRHPILPESLLHRSPEPYSSTKRPKSPTQCISCHCQQLFWLVSWSRHRPTILFLAHSFAPALWLPHGIWVLPVLCKSPADSRVPLPTSSNLLASYSQKLTPLTDPSIDEVAISEILLLLPFPMEPVELNGKVTVSRPFATSWDSLTSFPKPS